MAKDIVIIIAYGPVKCNCCKTGPSPPENKGKHTLVHGGHIDKMRTWSGLNVFPIQTGQSSFMKFPGLSICFVSGLILYRSRRT